MTEFLSDAQMRGIFDQVSNWRRWGEGDGLGTLNLITPERRRRAAQLVSEGRNVSLGRDFPTQPGPDNPYPAQHHMLRSGDDLCGHGVPGMEETSDYIGVAFHGFACTHIDALCHFFHEGRMFNGVPSSEVRSTGARAGSVWNLRHGVIGRGVLLDLPAALGVRALDPERPAGVDALEAAERRQGVRVESGDILLVRTGRDVVEQPFAVGEDGFARPRLAGMHPSVLPWLHAREIAALGGDGFHDPYGAPKTNDVWPYPIHACGLVSMGLHLIDNMYLEDALGVCQDLGRWTFQFMIAPLRILRGTGSPLNPVAVF
jgi:kynurenine formamidase